MGHASRHRAIGDRCSARISEPAPVGRQPSHRHRRRERALDSGHASFDVHAPDASTKRDCLLSSVDAGRKADRVSNTNRAALNRNGWERPFTDDCWDDIRDFPSTVSPDGTTVATARRTTEGLVDIYVLSLAGDRSPRALVTGPAFEGGPQFSPDGRWMAYVSNESGEFQVYLRSYPGPEGRWTVSTGGGTSPLWNPTGNELFYRNGNKMMAVSVSTTPDATLAAPRVIFERAYVYGSTVALTNYDVSADGQRFLMVKPESAVTHLSVVQNWFSELARLAPGGSR